jgi:lambda repressor-like predicted transcriptional regulator
MKINEVIERHGMQLRDVSREMGLKPSALQSAIDRNLTVKTLRLISEAAKIPIAEFFIDELTDEERQQLLAALNPLQHAAESASAGQQQAVSDEGGASDLPFGGGEPIPADAPTRSLSAISQQAIVCPHCHQALVFNIASYEQK